MKNDALREQVINHMADVAKAAIDNGEDGFRAIERAFPGTPSDVVSEAWVRADAAKIEDWWQMVEKTIDAESVVSAVKKVAAGGAS